MTAVRWRAKMWKIPIMTSYRPCGTVLNLFHLLDLVKIIESLEELENCNSITWILFICYMIGTCSVFSPSRHSNGCGVANLLNNKCIFSSWITITSKGSPEILKSHENVQYKLKPRTDGSRMWQFSKVLIVWDWYDMVWSEQNKGFEVYFQGQFLTNGLLLLWH